MNLINISTIWICDLTLCGSILFKKITTSKITWYLSWVMLLLTVFLFLISSTVQYYDSLPSKISDILLVPALATSELCFGLVLIGKHRNSKMVKTSNEFNFNTPFSKIGLGVMLVLCSGIFYVFSVIIIHAKWTNTIFTF